MGRGVVASGHGGAPVALKREPAMQPVAKFSAPQSLEKSQDGERISIIRGPASGVRLVDARDEAFGNPHANVATA
jgi:hypothetical protein